MRRQSQGPFLFDVAVGLVAGLLATEVTNLAQGPLRRLTPARVRRQERRAFPHSSSSLAAAEKLAPLLPVVSTPESNKALGVTIHFVTGMIWGPTYNLLRRNANWHPLAAAAASGTAMSLILDEVLVPRLGLSAPNRDYPAPTHLRGLAAHLVYGAALALAVETISYVVTHPALARADREARHQGHILHDQQGDRKASQAGARGGPAWS